MQLVRTRLGKDLHAAVTQLVVLRREGILVDTNFADRRLRRQLPTGKAVHVNLSAVRPSRRPSQRRQLALKLIRIIRQCVKVLARQHSGVRIVVRVNAQRDRVCIDVHYLRLLANLQLRIDRRARHRGNLQVHHRVRRKARHRHKQRVAARRDAQTIGSIAGRLSLGPTAMCRRQRNRCPGDQLTIRIGDRAMHLRSIRRNSRRQGRSRRRTSARRLCRRSRASCPSRWYLRRPGQGQQRNPEHQHQRFAQIHQYSSES